MAELRPFDAGPAAEGGLRDRHVETLLVEGLDAYFAGRYEDAIHVWTRVLFLDRAQARARAYIERARAALAERHRRGEVKLETIRELLDRGETAEARALLQEAMVESGDDERSAALRERLERAERVPPSSPLRPRTAAGPATTSWRPSRGVLIAAGVALVGLGIAATLLVVTLAPDSLGLGPTPEPAPPRAHAPGAGLTTDEATLIRARTLYAHGRLAEALQTLERIGASSPDRPAADTLSLEIERLLLATAADQSGARGGGGR